MGVLDAPVIQRESRGTKLRRLARQARAQNAWDRPYMKAVLPWQPSTAYIIGQVRVNAGNRYVCIIAGTSASSGGPTGTTSSTIADGTASWALVGSNTVTTDPSLTQAAWAASTAYTLGTQVTNGGRVYACVAAGTSAGSGGPTGTTNAITDGTVTWTYMGQVQVNPFAGEFPTVNYTTSSPAGLANIFNPANYAGGAAVLSALPVAGGSGYAVNDTITLTGGTGTACVLRVATVSSGAIRSVTVQTPGSYTVLPGSPTAQGTTSGSGTGATFALRFPQPRHMRVRGCYVKGSFSAAAWGDCATFQPAQNAAPVLQFAAQEFFTDGSRFAFRLGQNQKAYVAVIIDGVRYNGAELTLPTGADNWYDFDFSATSGRKVRHVRIEGFTNLAQIRVDGNSQVWAPDDANTVTCALVTDSMGAGSSYGPFVSGDALNLRLSHELGWVDVWPFATGGTGWINRGPGAGVTTDTYSTRVAQVLQANPDIVIAYGSTNDFGQSGISAAVTAFIQALRTGGYTGPIVIVGVWSINNAAVATVEAAVQAGVTGADPTGKTWFIPVYNDPALPWLTGSWNNNPAPSGASLSTSSNANLYLGGDGIHPIDAGVEYTARRIANAIREQVLPYVA